MTDTASPNDTTADEPAGPESDVGTRFGLLGPTEVVHRGAVREVPSGRQQALLAALLLRAGEVVSAPTLMEQVWGESVDRTVLNMCVMRLRRSLRDHDHDLIRADGNGYRVAVDPGTVDLHRFRRLRERAGEFRETGDRQRERELLRDALALWRGDAFTGIVSPVLQSEATLVLDEERLAAIESRIDADLECGAHTDVIGELRQLVAEHPFRERFWCQLLLALYRSGRQADALDAYRSARKCLTEELGVEPGDELRGLHRRVLSCDPALAVRAPEPKPESRPVPAQLPAGTAGFSGRADQLRQLDRLLNDTDPTPATVVIGPPGVGKTALAVHWSIRQRHRWPDGQLYIDLRGYGPEAPVRPIEALASFLRAIGVPAGQVPTRLAEASALFRSLTADRRTLIVLDNAATPDQVRPLLPGGNDCTVIVTSRDRLTGLTVKEGARQLSLEVLTDDEARSLLADTIGPERSAVEPDAIGELARLCGNLPLALRITAADLLIDPGRRVATHVAGLRGGNRLDALQVSDDDQLAVRTAFQLSYARLDPAVRQLFRSLGLFPGPEISLDTAAELAGADTETVGAALDHLVNAHLLMPRGPNRFVMHDLLRLYAAELAHQEETEATRQAAVQRLYDRYTRTAEAAALRLHPNTLRLPLSAQAARIPVDFDDAAASAWLETELPNLVAAIRHAAKHGPRLDACRLAATLHEYVFTKLHYVDWLTIARAGLVAARALGHLRAQAVAHLSLAQLHRTHSQARAAVTHLRRALALCQRDGWVEGEIAAQNDISGVYDLDGRVELTARHLNRALELSRSTNAKVDEAIILGNLSRVVLRGGRVADAVAYLEQALDLHNRYGSRTSAARTVASLGEAAGLNGEHDRARALLNQAIALQRELGDRAFLPTTLYRSAQVHLDAGDATRAAELAAEALALARETGQRRSEPGPLLALALVEERSGRYESARQRFDVAIHTAHELGNRYLYVRALIGWGAVQLRLGKRGEAQHHLDRAIAISRRLGYRLLEEQALAVHTRPR